MENCTLSGVNTERFPLMNLLILRRELCCSPNIMFPICTHSLIFWCNCAALDAFWTPYFDKWVTTPSKIEVATKSAIMYCSCPLNKSLHFLILNFFFTVCHFMLVAVV